MSQEGIKKLVGKIITDEEFKKSFIANRAKAVKQSGYDVSAAELEALATLKADDLEFHVNEVIGADHKSTELECGAKVKTWKPALDKSKIVLPNKSIIK